MIHRRAKSRFVPHNPEAVRKRFKKIVVRAHAPIRICPVCVKPIGKNERVSGHGANLMHEACGWCGNCEQRGPIYRLVR